MVPFIDGDNENNTSLYFGSIPSNSLIAECFENKGMFLVWIFKIFNLPPLLGTPISISLSNLPGRLSAGSSMLGTFVAAITTTLPLLCRPSILANN